MGAVPVPVAVGGAVPEGAPLLVLRSEGEETMSLMVNLGFEEPDLYRSNAHTVAHAASPRDPYVALCGAKLRTVFDAILFGTAQGALPTGAPKCVRCLARALDLGVE